MSKQVILMPTPANTRGNYAIAGTTGSMPFTLAATDILFAFQWTNPTHYAVLEHLDFSYGVTSTITTAVVTGLELVPVRDFFNAYTGGVRLNTVGVTGHEMKLKSNYPDSLVADIRIANDLPLDLPLVPGTEDGVPISNALFGTGTAVGVVGISPNIELYNRFTHRFPLVMDTFEGFVVRMALDGPATGRLRFGFHCEWQELTKNFY